MGDIIQVVDESGIERLVGTLHDPAATPGNVLTVQNDHSIAAKPGGGGGAGAAIVRAFPFAFNSPGLSDGTGFAVYTPTIGDVWLDSWIQIDTAWDGPTPLADVMQLSGGTFGLLGDQALPCDAANADATEIGTSPLNQTVAPSDVVIANANTGGQYRLLPGLFVTADPVAVWVTQNGQLNGADPAATHGSGVLYVVTATPA